MTASYHKASDHANKMILCHCMLTDWTVHFLCQDLELPSLDIVYKGKVNLQLPIYGGKMAGEFESVEKSLEKHLPPKELAEVRRILYGKELK